MDAKAFEPDDDHLVETRPVNEWPLPVRILMLTWALVLMVSVPILTLTWGPHLTEFRQAVWFCAAGAGALCLLVASEVAARSCTISRRRANWLVLRRLPRHFLSHL